MGKLKWLLDECKSLAEEIVPPRKKTEKTKDKYGDISEVGSTQVTTSLGIRKFVGKVYKVLKSVRHRSRAHWP